MAVFISHMSDVCQMFLELVSPCFGPNTQTTLISTADGKVTLTSDGLIIAESMHWSDPIAKLLVKSMGICKLSVGDGSKTMVLYVSGFVQGLSEYIKPAIGKEVASERAIKIELIRSLQKFQSYLSASNPSFSIANERKGCRANENISKCTQSKENEQKTTNLSPDLGNFNTTNTSCTLSYRFMSQLLTTQLSSKCRCNMSVLYCDLILQLVMMNDIINLEAVTTVINHFSLLCTKVVGELPIKSYVINSILVQVASCNNSKIKKSNVKFIMMNGSCFQHDELTIMHVTSNDELNTCINHKTSLYMHFLDTCRDNGIELILSSDPAPASFVHFCRQRCICFIDNLLHDDIKRLSSVFAVDAMSSLDVKCTKKFLGVFQNCDFIGINGRDYLKLQPFTDCALSKQLILCGQSKQACDQTGKMLLHSLLFIKYIITVHDQVKYPIPTLTAGGTFEFFMCKKIDEMKQNCDDRLGMTLLKNGLLKVPKTLFLNSAKNIHFGMNARYLRFEKSCLDSIETCNVMLDRDCMLTENGKGHAGVECWPVKMLVLTVAIETLCQLLKFDAIITSDNNI